MNRVLLVNTRPPHSKQWSASQNKKKKNINKNKRPASQNTTCGGAKTTCGVAKKKQRVPTLFFCEQRRFWCLSVFGDRFEKMARVSNIGGLRCFVATPQVFVRDSTSCCSGLHPLLFGNPQVVVRDSTSCFSRLHKLFFGTPEVVFGTPRVVFRGFTWGVSPWTHTLLTVFICISIYNVLNMRVCHLV